MALPVIWLCRRRQIPVIYDMQSSIPDQLRSHWLLGTRPLQRLLRIAERWMLVNADAVVCSAGLGQHVKRTTPGAHVTEWMFAGQLRGNEPDAPDKLRARLGIARDARVVLYTGTFEPYQGLDLLVDAIPAVVAAVPDAVFLIVGATDDEFARSPAVKPLVDAGHVIVVPRQPRRAIPSYLTLAEVLVSPRAYGDNVPLKIFDYMLSGRPIVATDITAHRSLLNENTSVLVPLAADALAEAVVRILRDPSLGRTLSSAALEEASRYPGGESFVNLVRGLYNGTLQADVAPGSPERSTA
jgi:glycosyltransferase involved in cell wall biosynthesis